MKDFVFIIGPSGVGKTTLAKGLFQHYNSVYFEQNMIPEFGIPDNVDPGKYEEEVLWESSLKLLESSTKKIMSRPLIPNEKLLDINGKSKEEVLEEAISKIESFDSLLEYDYELPAKELFHSWVLSDGLRNQNLI
ncbi:MAG: hypothetical protein IJR82_02090 [Bacilli bacterium]|nr:hypothetical protein [Bacilli bacterium]